MQAASRPMTMELATGPSEQDVEKAKAAAAQYISTARPCAFFKFTTKSLGLALQPISASFQQQHKLEGGEFEYRVQVEQLVAGGAGETCGVVSAGDIITHINNQNLDHVSYEEATQMLVAAGRPLTLGFLPLSLYITTKPDAPTEAPSTGLKQRRGGNETSKMLDPREQGALNVFRTLQQEKLQKAAMERTAKKGWGPWGWRLMLVQITIMVLGSMAFALYPRLSEMAGRATLL